MVRLLVVSDEVDARLTVDRLREMKPRGIISCGDLPPDYLDFVSSAANAPLYYVPGNHDPDPHSRDDMSAGAETTPPPPPGTDLDGRLVTPFGLRIVGLGGSVRYRPGPNQYTQSQMRRRVRALIRNVRWHDLGRRRPIDLFVTHSPPRGSGDEDDPAHQGFEAFHGLIDRLRPRLMLHGHIHPHGVAQPDREIGGTRVVNVIPHKLLEID